MKKIVEKIDQNEIHVSVPLSDIEMIRRSAECIRNPTVAFSFDQTEILHRVIMSQQGLAENIIALLKRWE